MRMDVSVRIVVSWLIGELCIMAELSVLDSLVSAGVLQKDKTKPIVIKTIDFFINIILNRPIISMPPETLI